MASQVFAHKVDSVIEAGHISARMGLPKSAWLSLPTDQHHPCAPWDVRYVPRSEIFPTTTASLRVTVASSVTTDNTWVSYVWCSGDWLPIPPIPEVQRVVLVTALFNELEVKKTELRKTQDELSTERLSLSLLRHEYERIRPQPTSRKLSLTTILALCFLVFSLFFHSAEATGDPNMSKIRELNAELDSFIQQALKYNYTQKIYMFKDTMEEKINEAFARHNAPWTSILIETCRAVVPYIWSVSALTLACLSVWKSKNPLASIVYLASATFTGFNFALLVVAPLQTDYSVFATVILTTLFAVEIPLAMVFSVVHLILAAVVGLFHGDPDYVQHIRAVFSITLIFNAGALCNILGIGYLPLTILAVTWRVARLYGAFQGSVIEVRASDGKVLSRLPTTPNKIFNFLQSMRRSLNQVRNVTVPLARVNPSALCHVSTTAGRGTGFFCANYIVTAAHVVGNDTTVNICYFGKNYTVPVKRLGVEKDYACLAIPPELSRVPRLKISKKHNCEWVCLCAPDGDGAYLTSVTQGTSHGDTYSYVTPTRDGMSGAPLLDVDGHVLGVHQTNTGYTGGAVRLDLDDIVDPPKNSEVADLKQQLEDLRKQLEVKDQCLQSKYGDDDIVALVRAAMQREMQILRDELLGENFQQAKGKNKKGRGALKTKLNSKSRSHKPKQRGPMFTEEEYQEMLDAGIDPEQIREMVDEYYDTQVGYPDWPDPEFSEEEDEDEDEWWEDPYEAPKRNYSWYSNPSMDDHHEDPSFDVKREHFVQSLKKIYKPEHVKEMYSQMNPAERCIFSQERRLLKHCLKKGIDTTPIVAKMDLLAEMHGVPSFSDDLEFEQRVKPQAKKSKNVKKGERKPQN
uniref:Nonstructural protein 1A n=1 Tax=Grey squirrel astrovirus TaxID=2730967 RepID=A0A6M3VXL8_9VIRU|nr:nonstructural protein 1A [Grey squirrel astrovirus]